MAPDPIKQESLPPTEYLIMETLAARYRLGEKGWTFPNAVRERLSSLAERGLVGFKSATIYGYQLAWLTDAGRACCLSDDYETPQQVVAGDRLAVMLADLDGYIERRAAELARPAIEEAERSAARFEERAADLREEFGRMVGHLESQLRAARRQLAAKGDADAKWSEAVDWLLNSRHTADPGIQHAFWGMADGELTREQADNGVFGDALEGNPDGTRP